MDLLLSLACKIELQVMFAPIRGPALVLSITPDGACRFFLPGENRHSLGPMARTKGAGRAIFSREKMGASPGDGDAESGIFSREKIAAGVRATQGIRLTVPGPGF